MTFLPIVERELRVGARRRGMYRMRVMVGGAALATALFLYAMSAGLASGVAGPRIFNGLATLAFIFCLFAGRRLTADCLSEEKRQGTLGLLFLTDLKGYDVVLGKLAATSISSFYGLLTFLPVLALPLLMGGVSNGQFCWMVLVLINTFLFSLSVGLLASVLNREARNAMGANLLLMLCIAGAPSVVASLLGTLGVVNWYLPAFCYSCPVFAFYNSLGGFYAGQRVVDFWASMAVIHLLTWGLIAMASHLVPGAWQDQPSATKRIRWWRRLGAAWREWLRGNGAQRAAHRKQLLDINAYYWLSARNRLKPCGVWITLALSVGWWGIVALSEGVSWHDRALAVMMALLLNLLIKTWVGIEAGQRLVEDRKEGALELLLSTPLGEREMLRGQWLALRRLFLKPLLAVVGGELVLMGVVQWGGVLDSGLLILETGNLFMLGLDVVTLFGVGIYASIKVRRPNQASLMTVSWVLLAPWVAFGVISGLVNLIQSAVGGKEPGGTFYFGLWLGLGIVTDLVVGLRAWRQVLWNFRELALRRVTQSDKST